MITNIHFAAILRQCQKWAEWHFRRRRSFATARCPRPAPGALCFRPVRLCVRARRRHSLTDLLSTSTVVQCFIMCILRRITSSCWKIKPILKAFAVTKLVRVPFIVYWCALCWVTIIIPTWSAVSDLQSDRQTGHFL